jgi:hypothetical protein
LMTSTLFCFTCFSYNSKLLNIILWNAEQW